MVLDVRQEPLLWDDMADGVALFLAMATQWRWAPQGMGGAFKTGLDYSALKPTADVLELAYTARTFLDVQILESEVLKCWADRRR